MEIVYHAASSLDGFIATEDGGVDWLTPFQESGEDLGFDEFFAGVDSLVMGSRTYEFMLEHPPWLAPDKPSFVFTRRELEIADPSVTLTPESPMQVVTQLEKRGLKRTWLMGGGQLATTFRKAGLISEYRIAIIPVILGGGIPLFAPGAKLDELQLTDTQSFASGIVQLTHINR